MKKASTTRWSQAKTTTTAKRSTKSQSKATGKAVGSVRIIGGQFKRRNISFVDGEGLRPTPDRLRETLFNWLLADIHDARVLDSCAGSGVLGFEALSRGAAHCTFIEANAQQAQTLSQNAEQLRLTNDRFIIKQGRAEVVLTQDANAVEATDAINTGVPFDIVFIDPPYADELWQPILTVLITQALIDAETLIYLEADKDLTPQLSQLTETLHQTFSETLHKKINETLGDNHGCAPISGFTCVKQSKVGQVVAGLYQLTSS